ncbi:MAG: S24 family peptidase [Sphingobium sp.]|nr:S24 family peptidase [Sphingobium sp.]
MVDGLEGLDARQALDRLIAAHGVNYSDLSTKVLNRNPAYIQQFIKRGSPRKLDEDDRRRLARYFGVDEAVLGGGRSGRGESATAAVRHPLSPRPAFPVPAVVTVPRLALGASAGAGSLDEDERAAGGMAFDSAWLRDLGVRGEQVSIIRVDGESMAPTLGHGDDIMVDHRDGADRLRDGIYVLRLDGVLMVKRIAVGPQRGRFSVLSDNSHYPDWPDIDPDLVAIVGRVLWVGRRVG